MKKIYMMPSTKMVNVELQQMIAATMGLDEGYTETDANNVASRRNGGFWDDDE